MEERYMPAKPAKRSNCLMFGCGAGCASIVVITVLVGGFLWWACGLYADQVKDELNKNAVIQQHIGKIDEISFEFIASGEQDDDDTLVFSVKGAKGTGVVTARMIDEGSDTDRLESGTLKLPDGKVHELLPAKPTTK